MTPACDNSHRFKTCVDNLRRPLSGATSYDRASCHHAKPGRGENYSVPGGTAVFCHQGLLMRRCWAKMGGDDQHAG